MIIISISRMKMVQTKACCLMDFLPKKLNLTLISLKTLFPVTKNKSIVYSHNFKFLRRYMNQ